MDNTVLTYNGIELYQSEIDILCDEYINTLSDPDTINKSMVFNGLLLYIYTNKLRYIIPDNSNNDYELFNNIFYSLYLPLCYKYDKTPTIIQFACLVNTSNAYLNELKNGIYRDGSKVNKNTTETVKKWFDVCEKDLLSKAIETNGIGSIFALKANYKYRDSDVPVLQVTTKQESSTPQELADKYGSVEKPEIKQIE